MFKYKKRDRKKLDDTIRKASEMQVGAESMKILPDFATTEVSTGHDYMYRFGRCFI
jgi:hypothetical protein